jgi:hypothetical protein
MKLRAKGNVEEDEMDDVLKTAAARRSLLIQ